jgi:hypothetical protein
MNKTIMNKTWLNQLMYNSDDIFLPERVKKNIIN